MKLALFVTAEVPDDIGEALIRQYHDPARTWDFACDIGVDDDGYRYRIEEPIHVVDLRTEDLIIERPRGPE